MTDQRPSDVLGALPRRRPHRRSDKRPLPAPSDPAAISSGPDVSAARASPARPRAPQGKQSPRPDAPARRKPPGKAKPTSARPQEPSAAESPGASPGSPRAAAHRPQRLRQPAQPAGVPATPRRRPAQAGGRHILGTAAQAAAELAEIGLSVSARALRGVVGRLPRP